MSNVLTAQIPSIDNKFKRGLLGTRPLVGLWLQLADNLAAEAVAYSGFDWLLVDAEHAPNEVPAIGAQLQAIALGSSAAICPTQYQ